LIVYKENDKAKIGPMVDRGTYLKKEKTERLKKMLPDNEK